MTGWVVVRPAKQASSWSCPPRSRSIATHGVDDSSPKSSDQRQKCVDMKEMGTQTPRDEKAGYRKILRNAKGPNRDNSDWLAQGRTAAFGATAPRRSILYQSMSRAKPRGHEIVIVLKRGQVL